jgi:hypothetical protein
MHRLNELRLAGSVMNLTSTVPLVTITVFSLGLTPELAFGAPCPCCFPLRIGVFDFSKPTSLQLISSFPFASSLEVVGAILLVVCN